VRVSVAQLSPRKYEALRLHRVAMLRCWLATGSLGQTTTTLPASQSATVPSDRRRPLSDPWRCRATCQSAVAQVFIGRPCCFPSLSQYAVQRRIIPSHEIELKPGTLLDHRANAITTAQVIEELIQLAKDIRAARARGEETGLTDEEIAFYDALAENESARQVMGEPALRVIATELVASIKSSVSVDWMHREAARARMRVLVKRLLRKYGYPPDLRDAAVQKVLQQAEALSADWAA
jgi:Domain of unknown function (DUF3387)